MKRFISLSLLIWAGGVFAHDIEGVPLPLRAADDPRVTHMATVLCEPGTDFLMAQIRDDTPPVPELKVNLQLVKGRQAGNTTDPISGDGGAEGFSPPIVLRAGEGAYKMIANKTGFGQRVFSVVYHCMRNDNFHTGTEIQVDQVDWP